VDSDGYPEYNKPPFENNLLISSYDVDNIVKFLLVIFFYWNFL